jgi:hypothetical protein
MSDKIYHLKKDGFLVKIMRYIWGFDYHDFSHMCPFFWLSVFNLIIIIPYFCICKTLLGLKLVGKWLGKHAVLISEVIDEKIGDWDKRQHERYLERLEKKQFKDVSKLTSDKIRKIQKIVPHTEKNLDLLTLLWEKYEENLEAKEKRESERRMELAQQKRLQKEADKIQEFKSKAKDMSEDEIQHIIATKGYWKYLSDYQASQEELELAKKKEAKRKINHALKIVKPILTYSAYTVGSIVAMGGLYFLGKFLIWFVNFIGNQDYTGFWSMCKEVLIWLGIGLIGIGILLLIGYFILKPLFRLMAEWDISGKIGDTLEPIINVIWRIIKYPFVKIWKLVDLIVTMIKNECPPIKWE